jgi:hypothetical protein
VTKPPLGFDGVGVTPTEGIQIWFAVEAT